MDSTEVAAPEADVAERLMTELRETILAEGSVSETVIVDVDVDLDALLATLPRAEPPPA
jgi:hypothetical protein